MHRGSVYLVPSVWCVALSAGCGGAADDASTTGSETASTEISSTDSSSTDSSGIETSTSDTSDPETSTFDTSGSETDTGEPECGDAIVDAGEECDDGNAIEWDGCSSECVAGYLPDPVTLGLELPPVVPVLRVDVGGQEIIKDVEIVGQLEIFEAHDGTLSDLDNLTPTWASVVGFQGRGNYTWTLPKKGYAFELQDDLGASIDASILGLPPGSDFALYACWSDKTCMRNALVFALGQQLGRWSPRTRFVELFIDGDYLGLYMVWERIRRDVARCDIDKPAPTANDGDLEGGYILRHEGAGKGIEIVDGMMYNQDFVLDSGLVYTYHYPSASEITPEQSTYLVEYMQGFEYAMDADPSAYASWIDELSWVDRGIVEELTNNWDGYVHSVYMTKDSMADGGLLGMGPLWDFDLAFANGNVTGYNCQTNNWAYQIVRPPPDNMPNYWLALFADDEFRNAFKCRWQELRTDAISLATFEAQIAAWVDFTVDARARDQARWGTVGNMIFPNCFSAPDYMGEIDMLLAWISARIAWLDAQTAAMPGVCR
jgi:cysteine-rich repeat protein